MAELFRSLHIKVFTSDKKKAETFTFHPTPGKVYTRELALMVASDFVHKLKEQFPGNEFQMVAIRANRFNVIPMAVN